MLKVILFNVNHGFYTNQEDINRITGPILDILDGSNDTYKVNGRDMQLGVKRYFPNVNFDAAVIAKCLACDILIQIARLETDQKCSIILSKLKKDIENQGNKLIDETEEERYTRTMEYNRELLAALNSKKGFES